MDRNESKLETSKKITGVHCPTEMVNRRKVSLKEESQVKGCSNGEKKHQRNGILYISCDVVQFIYL